MKTFTTRANVYLIRCHYHIPHTIPYTLPSIFLNSSIALVVGKLAGEQPRILMLVASALTRWTAGQLRRLEPVRAHLVRRLGSKMREDICANDYW